MVWHSRRGPAVIKRLVEGLLGVFTLVVWFAGIRSCLNEEAQHHPELTIQRLIISQKGNEYFYTWNVCNEGDENATKPHLQFFEIDTSMTRQVSTQPVPPTSE